MVDVSKTVTVLVEQTCHRCGRTIPAKTGGVLVESGIEGGDFFRRYVCPECRAEGPGRDGR